MIFNWRMLTVLAVIVGGTAGLLYLAYLLFILVGPSLPTG